MMSLEQRRVILDYSIVVLVKQVPDTHNVSGDVMKEDGTINRAILPTIFNPEDLNALEMALSFKERFGGKITVITMGPPSASEVLRQSLYRGADEVYLASDIKFAGADTWATAYTLAAVIKKVAPRVTMVLAGRQAIDGDTAQVGPQVAEKLNIPQVTYLEEIHSVTNGHLKARRQIDGGVEEVEIKMPFLGTVVEANTPRPAEVRKMMRYKNMLSRLDYKQYLSKHVEYTDESDLDAYLRKHDLLIPVITAADLDVDIAKLGLFGSPTKVKKIENVVLKKEASKTVPATEEGSFELLSELVKSKIIG